MKVKEKDFREMGSEEQVTGWNVRVYLKDYTSNPFGGSYQVSVVTGVNSRERANKVASDISLRGRFAPTADEDILIIPDTSRISHIMIEGIKRIIYYKK